MDIGTLLLIGGVINAGNDPYRLVVTRGRVKATIAGLQAQQPESRFRELRTACVSPLKVHALGECWLLLQIIIGVVILEITPSDDPATGRFLFDALLALVLSVGVVTLVIRFPHQFFARLTMTKVLIGLCKASSCPRSIPKLLHRCYQGRMLFAFAVMMYSMLMYNIISQGWWGWLAVYLLVVLVWSATFGRALRNWIVRRERVLDWYSNRLARKYVRSQGET